MGSLCSDPLKPSLRSAAAKSQEMQLLGTEDIIKSVQKRMEDVTEYLYKGLETVYSKEDREMLRQNQGSPECGQTPATNSRHEYCCGSSEGSHKVH